MGTISKLSTELDGLNTQFNQIQSKQLAGKDSNSIKLEASSKKYAKFFPADPQHHTPRVKNSGFAGHLKNIAGKTTYQVAWAGITLAKLPLALLVDICNSDSPTAESQIASPVFYKKSEIKVSQIAKFNQEVAALAEKSENLIACLPDSAERDQLIESLDQLLKIATKATARSKAKKTNLDDGIVKLHTNMNHKRSLRALDRVIQVKSSIMSQLALQTERIECKDPETNSPKRLSEMASAKIATIDDLHEYTTRLGDVIDTDINDAIEKHRSVYQERLTDMKKETSARLKTEAMRVINAESTRVNW